MAFFEVTLSRLNMGCISILVRVVVTFGGGGGGGSRLPLCSHVAESDQVEEQNDPS